jgi:toxin-antitoxin system PIN domain toxin
LAVQVRFIDVKSTTMPVEPGLVDANVLVYAMDADAPQHATSRALLESARATSATVFVSLQTLCEFYSVVTNPRRVSKPRSPADALSAISGLLSFVHVLPVPAATVDRLLDLLRRRPVTGGDIFDLHLAATMKANGILRIYTFKREDFESFSELEVLTPGA